MRDFMSACDHCLSGCSNDGHILDDEGCDPTRECFHIDQEDHGGENHLSMPGSDGALAPASRVEIPRELAVVQVPAGVRTYSLSNSTRCRPSSAKNQGSLCSSDKTSSRSGQAGHSLREHIIWPGTSSAALLTMPGCAAPGLQRGRSEPSRNSNVASNNSGAIHHRRVMYPGRAQGPPRRRRCPKSRELYLSEARGPLGASRNALPTHAGGLGPHRAHMGRDACSPGSPRRRATPPRPSSPTRGKGAPRLPPQARGRYDSEEDRSPSPEPLGPRVFSRAIRRAPFPARF
jgi:hypothetical protein